MDDPTARRFLEICYDVRKRLHENGVKALSLDFPILPMKALGVIEDSHYLGFCHADHEDWVLLDETHKMSRSNIVKSVEICLQDPTTNEIYTLERILPTLLHEFAHCITPGLLVYGHDEKGKPKRKWGYNAHNDTFYDNFSLILDVAEKQGIYKLPTGFSKNNKISLRRFDNVDVDGKNVFVGQTSLFKSDPSLSPSSSSSSSSQSSPQKLVVANEKGETKLVVLKGIGQVGTRGGEAAEGGPPAGGGEGEGHGNGVDWLEELRDGCIRKFQVKKKKGIIKFTTQKGETIVDSAGVLRALQQQEPIIFRVA